MPEPPRPPHWRERPTRPITLVLRVQPSMVGSGRVVGTVEVVDTGDLVPISEVGDLVTLLARLAAPESAEHVAPLDS